MKAPIIKPDKRLYISPAIECIELDNAISLALESDPSSNGDDEVGYNAPKLIKTDPFRNMT